MVATRRPRLPWWLAIVLGSLLTSIARDAEARTELTGPFFHRWGAAAPLVDPPGRGWQQTPSLRDVPQQGGDALWLAVRLPASEGDVLFLPRTYLAFDAYVDGRLIGADHGPAAGARAWHMLALPADAGGRWLTLHVRSDYSKIGLRGPMYLGKRYEHVEAMLRADLPRSLVILLALLLAVAAAVLALRNVERRAAAGLGAWALSVALWNAFYLQLRDLLWNAPRAWLWIWAIGLAAMTPAFLWFFRATFADDVPLVRWLWRIHVASSLAGVALLGAGAPASVTNPYLAAQRALIAVAFVAVIYVLVRRLRAGDRDAGPFSAGVATYTVFGVHDLLLALGVVPGFETQTHWGLLAWLASGGWVLQRRLAAMRRRLDRYQRALAVSAQEREMMLRDLHDGLGRITTGISMLTEVAKRDRNADQPLDGIADLASEGSQEIRAFMRGLDDEARDWVDLQASMREQAARLVETLGGRYQLDVDIPEGAESPSALLFVHLLRVFQEGLTNALKHAREPLIRARLVVAPDGVTLEVENDGITRDATGAGVGLGAGLTNMRARAHALGGDLRFERDHDRARLCLTIPLPLRYAASASG